ncbi:MAG: EsaB/YukD family protein [Myxococcota bacterium]
MSGQLGVQSADAGTVTVRVQVVDVESAALDLVIPTYLPAKDVTQRIARDASLGAYWPDGTRRAFWIRARGRLLGDDEKLQDLGVVNGELIHILPQPPPGSQVIERPAEFPRNTGYRGGNISVMLASALTTIGLAGLWAVALTIDMNLATAAVLGLVPALGVGLLGASTARHIWGPPSSSIKVPATALVLVVPLVCAAYAPAFLMAAAYETLFLSFAAAFFGGIGGSIMGWLAWFGAVEPLPEQLSSFSTDVVAAESHVAQCAICAQDVDLADMENRQDCVYQCGRVFHAGCYRARAAIAREGQCAVCGYEPPAA